MRHAYGNPNVEPKRNTYGDINTNSDSYGSGLSYTYSDGYSWHTVTHADLRTRGHTRAVGHVHAWAAGSLSCGWLHRWNKCLRLWRR